MTMKLASSPSRNSSTSTSRPASPNWPANMASAAAIAASVEGTMTTPLPAASPLAFTTSGVRWPRTQAGSKLSRVKVAERAVGMPCRRRNSLAKAFEPSSLAAARRGPKQLKPASAKASAMPATSGASGPTMVRPTRSARASWRRAAMSSAATPMLRTRGSPAVPALPGATSTSVTRAAAAHFQASACSRPPPPTIRIFIGQSLVTEVTHAGEHHRHVVLVGCGDDLRVALAAARLDDRADAEACGNIQIVAKRQERIGRHYRARERDVLVACLHGGDARGIHATHLPGAHADRGAAARENDRVRLDEPAHAPREAQVGELRGRRLTSGGYRERFLRWIAAVARLHEQTAGDAAVLELATSVGCEIPEQQHAHVRLAREHARRILLQRRQRQHLDELTLGDDGGGGRVQLAVEGDDAPERRGRIGSVGALVGGEETRAHGRSTGVGVLDDHTRRLLELAHAFDGGVGVRDVVERQILALQHARGGNARARPGQLAVERRDLMWIFAVAQVLDLVEGQRQGAGKGLGGGRMPCRE